MLWLIGSAFFAWLAWMELRQSRRLPVDRRDPGPTPLNLKHLAILLLLALGCAWFPIEAWRMERYLTGRVRLLLGTQSVQVHCRIFDIHFGATSAAYAVLATGTISMQRKYCRDLMRYRAHPRRATPKELFALHLLTHEAMHLRGERNEARADCQAVQRNAQVAQLLGVPPDVARQNARDFYVQVFRTRSLPERYVSTECAPGRDLDEHLEDPVWALRDSP